MESDSFGFISDIFSALWEVVASIIGAIVVAAPKVISFILWCLLAIFVLPCVFVAGTIYPMWVEWGEDL